MKNWHVLALWATVPFAGSAIYLAEGVTGLIKFGVVGVVMAFGGFWIGAGIEYWKRKHP